MDENNTYRLPEPGKPYPAGSDRPYEHERMEGEDHADDRVFVQVLEETAALAARWGRPHAFIGGLASAALGRDRWTHDIDLLVRPQDARGLLQALADAGYDTEERDQSWLYKAYRHGIMIDLIFRIALRAIERPITLDEQAAARVREREFRGVRMPLISPEDLVVIKALCHQEFRSRHWFDALGLVANDALDLDWDYLVERAVQHGPRRVLSLLLYAQSDGLHVPDRVVDVLYEEAQAHAQRRERRPAPGEPGEAAPAGDTAAYLAGQVMDRFARDPRTAELEVDVELYEDVVVLTGCVATEERRAALTTVAQTVLPDHQVRNHVTVAAPAAAPDGARVEQVR